MTKNQNFPWFVVLKPDKSRQSSTEPFNHSLLRLFLRIQVRIIDESTPSLSPNQSKPFDNANDYPSSTLFYCHTWERLLNVFSSGLKLQRFSSVIKIGKKLKTKIKNLERWTATTMVIRQNLALKRKKLISTSIIGHQWSLIFQQTQWFQPVKWLKRLWKLGKLCQKRFEKIQVWLVLEESTRLRLVNNFIC